MTSGRAMRLPSLLALAAVLGLTGLVVSPSPAHARPGQAATGITLLRQDPWLHRGGQFHLRVRVDGPPPNAQVAVERLGAIGSRSELDNVVEKGTDGKAAKHRLAVPLAGLAVGADRGVDLTYPMADDPGLTNFGVYPVRVKVQDQAGNEVARLVTFLVVRPDGDGDPPLDVAMVMEVGAPNGLRPDGKVKISDEARSAISQRITILSGAKVPLTVAPRPETIDALDDPANPDPGDKQLVSQLVVALAGRRALARPYVELDLDALARANLLTQVPPETDAGAQVMRTRFRRTGLEAGIWLAGPTLGEAGARAMRDIARAPYAIVPRSAVDRETVPTEPVTLPGGGPVAFVSDDGLANRLTGRAGAIDAQRFLAELAIIWMQDLGTERGVVVRLPEDAQLDVDTVATALDGLAGGGAVKATTAADLFQRLAPPDAQPETVHLAPHNTPDFARLVDPLGRAQTMVPALAGTLDDRALVGSLQRSLLVSLGSETQEDRRRAYITRIDKVVGKLANQISAPEDFQITLTARDGTIPLTLTNSTKKTVSVAVHLSSSQLIFDKDTREVRLPPGNTRLDLSVRTRTSGAFPLDISVTSPDGGIVLDETTFTIRSTAVSGAGIFLSVGAGLFLLVWWARHWRTAKRSQRLVADGGAGDGAAPGARPLHMSGR